MDQAICVTSRLSKIRAVVVVVSVIPVFLFAKTCNRQAP